MRRTWVIGAALLALTVWPGTPLAVLAWSLHSAAGSTARLMQERSAAEAALVAPAPPAPLVRAVSTNLARVSGDLLTAAWALDWLGNEGEWPAVGAADRTLRDGIQGSLEVARAAATVWRAAIGRRAGISQAVRVALAQLPESALGLRDLSQAARHLPVPAQWRRAVTRAAPLLSRLAAVRRPLAEALGFPHPARYLVLLQDAAELRATGGLVVAYGWLTLRQGRPALRFGGGIQALSRRVRVRVPAGSLLHRFFGESRLSLLNANDRLGGPASTAAILRLYRSVPGAPPVVGAVLVNSWWIATLFGMSGPVAVPSPAGRVVLTAATAPRQLEQLAERDQVPGVPRMAFLGPVMRELAARLMPRGVPSLPLVAALGAGVRSGGVLWEPGGRALARLAGALGWSGALWPTPAGGNYLMLVNQNFGGLKDNLYLGQRAAVTVVGRREQVRLVLTLRRRVTAQNAWLLGSYEGWVSVVVPRGTRVVRATGFVSPVTVTSGASPARTVVGGAVTVPVRLRAPSSAAAISLILQLPRDVAPDAPLLVQAQPGWRPGSTRFTITLGGRTAEWDPGAGVLVRRRGRGLAAAARWGP